MASKTQRSLPASYYRGGTSRALIFNRADLPASRSEWAPIFRGVIGSPDPENGRQLDGMGGGISSLSKICVVEPTDRDADADAADVDYTFVQIGVRGDEVDYSSNCGNMTSAIGPYAVDSGLVKKGVDGEGKVTVRIRNTNTGKIIDSTFPVGEDGMAATYGEFTIDGVAGAAAKIRLAFLDPSGSKTGTMLPTASAVDTFDGISATCIDVGNPCVFVPASKLDVPGDLTPDAIDAHPTLLKRLDSIRRQAALKMGIAKSESEIPGSIPKIAIVSPSSSSSTSPQTSKSDIVVRAVSVGQPHRAIPITVAMAVAAAAKVPGSTVEKACSASGGGTIDPDGITIGHPTGRLLVAANFDKETGSVRDATVFRTARLLMKGEVFWRP